MGSRKQLQTVWKMSKSENQSPQQKLLIDETLSTHYGDKKNHPASANNAELGAAGQIVFRNYWTIKILFGCKMHIAAMLAAQCPPFSVCISISASLSTILPFCLPRGLLPFLPAGFGSLSNALTLLRELIISSRSINACTDGRDTMKLFLHGARIIRALVRGKNQSERQLVNTKTKLWTTFFTFQLVHFGVKNY